VVKATAEFIFLGALKNPSFLEKSTGLPSSVCAVGLCYLYVNGRSGCEQKHFVNRIFTAFLTDESQTKTRRNMDTMLMCAIMGLVCKFKAPGGSFRNLKFD